MRQSFNLVLPGMALLGAALLAMPSAGRASDKGDPAVAPPVFQAVIDCRKNPDPAERLACYDRTVAVMADARSTKDLVVADRDTMREARRGLFGLSLPTLRLFGGGGAEEITAIDGTIDSSYAAKDGNFVFVLTDGGRWKQIEGRPAYARKGDSIHIEKASLGSYFAKIGKSQSARVVRIQ